MTPPASPPLHFPRSAPPVFSPALSGIPSGSGSRGRVLPITALVVAVAAGVLSGIALTRQSQSPARPSAPLPAPSSAPLPSASEVAAAKTTACAAWSAASNAMVYARQPFVNSPPNWNDPITVSALVEAQSGIVIQIEYLRQHVSAATPSDVASPIADYIAASIDLAAFDGQHQPAAVANAAADRGAAAAAKIRSACGS
jgi:hypothetical protein